MNDYESYKYICYRIESICYHGTRKEMIGSIIIKWCNLNFKSLECLFIAINMKMD